MYDSIFHNENLQDFSVLITGGAGFIGSNIAEYLLKYQTGKVRVLDDFSTGKRENISAFLGRENFELIEGDIRDADTCRKAVQGMDFVLHQAALGSVPRSINDPLTTHEVNTTGFLNMLLAASETPSVRRFVYAASSSTYGDSTDLPKVEERIGKPLSPYAVTKYVNELYAGVFGKIFGTDAIGLRYFNVFGPRQDPHGAYAAVIPLFMKAAIENVSPEIHGDGEQTRDFTFVENAVQANIKAMFAPKEAANQVYNIAVGNRTSLNQLWSVIARISGTKAKPVYGPAREGDVRDSLADISKAYDKMGYYPEINLIKGLEIAFEWYKNHDFNGK